MATSDPKIAVDEVDTTANQSGVLSPTTEQALDQLPLAAAASEDLESDIVLHSSISNGAAVGRWKRPALLLALVALVAIAISFGVSNNRANATSGGTTTENTTTLVQQANKQETAPQPAPQPAPVPPPNKAAPAVVVVASTPVPTEGATDGGTATVGIYETAPPTVEDREGQPVIESPTWRE